MRSNVGHTIIGYFRDFQKLNRFIVLNGGPSISLAAIHALIEVDAQPGISIGLLSQVLDMPRTSVATIVEGVRRRRLLSNKRSKHDKRYHELFITKTGVLYLRGDDAVAEQQLRWLLEPLSPEQQQMLRALFRSIADGSGLIDCPERPGEHPLRKELRRSTRALRLIHNDFFGSGMGSPEWQLLNLVLTRRNALRVSQAASELQIPLSSATTILARLRKKGLIRTKRDLSDRRASYLALCAHAESYCTRVEGQMSEKVTRAISSVEPHVLKAQLEAFAIVVSNRAANDR